MYMLDTDTCSYVLKTKSPELARRFAAEQGNLSISEIVLAELRYGAARHPTRSQEIHALVDDFVLRLNVVPWAASTSYGELRSYLEQQGTPIGNFDTLIAAHALHHQQILVTNNTRHFSRVPNLELENWT